MEPRQLHRSYPAGMLEEGNVIQVAGRRVPYIIDKVGEETVVALQCNGQNPKWRGRKTYLKKSQVVILLKLEL